VTSLVPIDCWASVVHAAVVQSKIATVSVHVREPRPTYVTRSPAAPAGTPVKLAYQLGAVRKPDVTEK
jgi:hypothetical protein